MIGARVKSRLEEVGMSQSELARRVKLTQPAINALIRGSSRTSLHLHRIAQVLNTTPAYLEGETDDPSGAAAVGADLDSETQEMVDHFTTLSAADRRALLQVARSMSDGPAAHGTVQDRRLGFKPDDRS